MAGGARVASVTRLRALTVIRAARLADAGALELAHSTNEVWFAGPYVIRISDTPGSRRLHYEAAVAAHLPPEVPYPEIVAVGSGSFGEWMVLRRAPGSALSRAWPDMGPGQRRAAVQQLGETLRCLHKTTLPAQETPFSGDTLECPHQLPVPRLLRLIERAARLPHVDPGVLDAAGQLARQLGCALDGSGDVLLHGDLHFENVVWDGTAISAVLDVEWARPGPADLDLDVFLRFCADPALHVTEDYGHRAARHDYRPVPGWLRDAYPELFSHPRLLDRLAVYGLAYDVRHLLLDPPQRPADQLPPHHPYLRVRRWVDGRNHLAWMHW